jgi:hypothetical protein
MSYMLEVYYREPADEAREGRAAACAATHGGRLGYREEPTRAGGPVCLTFEFPGAEQARAAAESLRGRGEHVEGPAEYGP